MSSQRVAAKTGKKATAGKLRPKALPLGEKSRLSEKSPLSAKSPLGEKALIERIRTRSSLGRRSPLVRLGMGDDCAILAPPRGHEVLVTTDFSLEGRHFRRDWHSATSAGHRALARGLSDLAAMGAQPMAAFLSLALPRSLPGGWVNEFLDGFLTLAKKYGVPLAGGDTSESPSAQVLADVVLLGSAPAGTALRRSGARPGDVLYCTGTLGGAAQELAQLAAAPEAFRNATAARALRRGGAARKQPPAHPHLFPEPRLAAGKLLRERGLATACIDLSDGLSTDLAHLCAASGVAAQVDEAALPLALLPALKLRRAAPPASAASSASAADPASTAESALALALNGGEDYELLFTAAADAKLPKRLGGVDITRIGRILKAQKNIAQVVLLSSDGRRRALPPGGWEHLR